MSAAQYRNAFKRIISRSDTWERSQGRRQPTAEPLAAFSASFEPERIRHQCVQSEATQRRSADHCASQVSGPQVRTGAPFLRVAFGALPMFWSLVPAEITTASGGGGPPPAGPHTP